MSFILNLLRAILHNMLQLLSFSKKKLTNSLSIYIKSNLGNTISVDLDPKWDIKNVKEIVAPQLGLQPEEVKIIFAGKELCDSTIVEECDLGEQSILHAVKAKPKHNKSQLSAQSTLSELNEDASSGSRPLNETLMDLQLSPVERNNVNTEAERKRVRAHFFVYCAICKGMQPGKLRVRCELCKSGAFTVDTDPQCWEDVLRSNRITGICENENDHPLQPSTSTNNNVTFAQFYFKCTEHTSQGEKDEAVPLYLIKPNIHEVPCIACTDISDPVFVFPCEQNHVSCLDCFRQYCGSRLRDRQFWSHETFGYTLDCPAQCPNSFIEEIHHFRLLTEVQYTQYQRFATEEYILRQGGVFCPQPGCGMGILLEEDCEQIVCRACGYTWSRNANRNLGNGAEGFNTLWTGVQQNNADRGRWFGKNMNNETLVTKPCPRCGVPTERDGGCMHMICGRGSCKFHWCWVCHSAWTRDCMASHWFD